MEEPEPEPLSALEMRIIGNRLSEIYHDLTNPLSIITGNAELFLEIARPQTVDEELVQSVQDISVAAQQLAGILEQLKALRTELVPSTS